MTKKFLFLFGLFFILVNPNIYSQAVIELDNSSKISVLTSTPWSGAAYGAFGHAAIRVKDIRNDIDIVFNYGVFDFESPNFTYRFAKGETDYILLPIPFSDYITEYQEKGVEVKEQIISLFLTEKQKIWSALYVNSLPENRRYRYNFFFNNCSTRLLDIIEKNISRQILLPKENTTASFRQLINPLLEKEKWTKFGINLVLGVDADKIVQEKEKSFLPQHLYELLNNSSVKNSSGNIAPLVESRSVLFPQGIITEDTSFFSPTIVGVILFIAALALSLFQWKNRQRNLIVGVFDSILFTATGITGIILSFLMFFSVHPCMLPNWNYVWLHPLHLIPACLFYAKRCSKFIYCYHFINFALLTVFLLAWKLIPQELEWSFLPYVLTLWVRSAANVFASRRNMKKH